MENSESGSEKSVIVTARGTGDGLVIRLDGRVESNSLREALRDFMISRRKFLQGNEVSLEWVGAKPSDDTVSSLSDTLERDFNVRVRASKLRNNSRVANIRSEGDEEVPEYVHRFEAETFDDDEEVPGDDDVPMSLFDGITQLGITESEFEESREDRTHIASNAALWDDPDARMIYTTLRSGQKLETEHSVVVFGDVNSGAEIIAGGDIVVLGTLRGVAHAGAYDETGGGRIIFALNLQPTQLRIGMVITRGAGETNRGAEIARVEGTMIVVEPYQARSAWMRRHEKSIG